MYLDYTYFQGPLNIPALQNRRGVGAVLQSVSEKSLEWYLVKYEEEFLNQLLGKTLCAEMVEGVKAGDERMIALRDRIYKVGDISYSPAANYVYFKVMQDYQTQTSLNGEVRGTQTHSNIVPAYDKLVRVWNDMVSMCRDIHDWMIEEGYGHHNCFMTINKFGI